MKVNLVGKRTGFASCIPLMVSGVFFRHARILNTSLLLVSKSLKACRCIHRRVAPLSDAYMSWKFGVDLNPWVAGFVLCLKYREQG